MAAHDDPYNREPGSSPQDKAQSYASRQAETEEFTQDYSQLYNSGLAILQQSRFYLKRSPTGSHCGHNVYVRSKPRDIAGVTYPHWYRVLRLIDTAEEEEELTAALLRSPSASTEIQQFWSPLTQPVSGQKSTPLQGHVERLLRIDDNNRRQNESLPFELGIQVTNFTQAVASSECAPRAHLPPREWFAPQLQKLKFTDVFTLWPNAESEMLQLILGKAWVGRGGSRLVGEPQRILEHTFRSVGIIVGEDAGLGKSTVFDKLFRATNKVGYRQANFRNIGEQFGMGDVIEADVAYKDDLVGASLKDLVSSENTKIIASGGRMFFEDKFQKGASRHCYPVLLANTNEWNPRLAYSLDSGTVDRIKLLTTFRRNEIDKGEAVERLTEIASDSPNLAPFVHLPWLAQKLDVSEEALMLWACRLCADKFIELTFWRGDVPTEELRLEIHRISSHLRYSFNKDATRAVVSLMLLAHVLVTHLQNVSKAKKPYAMREISEKVLQECFTNFSALVTDKDMYRLKSVLKLHWEHNGRPDIHPWSGMRKLNLQSIAIARAAFDQAIAARSSLPDMIKALFGNLVLRDGFTGSSDIVWVNAAWQSNQGYIDDIEKLARALLKTLDMPGMEKSVEAMDRVSSGQPECGWLRDVHFSPKELEKVMSLDDRQFDSSMYTEHVYEVAWPY